MLGHRRPGRRTALVVALVALSFTAFAPDVGAVTPPVARAVSDSPDPVKAGGLVTFVVDYTDAAMRPVRALVCSTPFTTAGACTDTTLGTGAFGPAVRLGSATATYRPTNANVGTRTYYAFACDDLGQCSNAVSGPLTVNSNWGPSSNGLTWTPTQVVPNGFVNFRISFTNSDGDGEQAIVCKTDQTAWNGTLSCPGGAWAGPSSYHPSSGVVQASHQATLAEMGGPHGFFAYVCDDFGACSGPRWGTFTVIDNDPPNALGASVNNDPVLAGTRASMTLNWGDSDWDNGDTWSIHVCKSSSWTLSGGCAGGTWALGTATNHPFNLSFTVPTTPGAYGYWVFLCDREPACASPKSGTFNVAANNSAPVVTAVTDSPDPVTDGKLTFTVWWTDANAGDLQDVRICGTNALSGTSCQAGQTLVFTLDRATSPTTLTYFVPTGTIGVKDYWAFACDAVGNCSSGAHGTYTAL